MLLGWWPSLLGWICFTKKPCCSEKGAYSNPVSDQRAQRRPTGANQTCSDLHSQGRKAEDLRHLIHSDSIPPTPFLIPLSEQLAVVPFLVSRLKTSHLHCLILTTLSLQVQQSLLHRRLHMCPAPPGPLLDANGWVLRFPDRKSAELQEEKRGRDL